MGTSIKIQIFGVCLDESGRDVAECRRKVSSGRKGAGAIRACSLSVVVSCITCACSYVWQ